MLILIQSTVPCTVDLSLLQVEYLIRQKATRAHSVPKGGIVTVVVSV